ncbi:MAG: hypothetical protein ACI9J3_001225 [Parvicellaceae bacterium]
MCFGLRSGTRRFSNHLIFMWLSAFGDTLDVP